MFRMGETFPLDHKMERIFVENDIPKAVDIFTTKKVWKQKRFINYSVNWIIDCKLKALQLQVLSSLKYEKGLFKGKSFKGTRIAICPSDFMGWAASRAKKGFDMLHAAPFKKQIWEVTDAHRNTIPRLNNLENWSKQILNTRGELQNNLPTTEAGLELLGNELKPELRELTAVLLEGSAKSTEALVHILKLIQ